MSEWIPLDMVELANPRDLMGKQSCGSIVNVVMSPHDVPIALRGLKDLEEGRFVIEFRYLDDEPTKEIQLSNGAKAVVGKHSDRLYGFSFPHTEGKVIVQIMESTFDQGIQQLMQSHEIEQSQLTNRNLGAAKHAVDSKGDELVTVL